MKQSNQEPMGELNSSRHHLDPAAESHLKADADSVSRLAFAQGETSGSRATGFGRLRQSAARRAAEIRDRLDNRVLPDAEPGANGIRPAGRQQSAQSGAEGIRSVRMLPTDTELPAGARVTDDTVVTPRLAEQARMSAVNGSASAEMAAPGGEAMPMSGTYIDLTQPTPGAGARVGGLAAGDATGSVSGLREAMTQTMRAYRRRRAADRSIRRDSRERVYRLKGYTTVAKVNRKFASERRQRLLRRVLTMIIIFLTLILLFQIYNPIRDLSEWYRIIGIQSLDDQKNTQGSGTIQSGSVSITPAPTTTAPTTTATTKPGATTRTTTRR